MENVYKNPSENRIRELINGSNQTGKIESDQKLLTKSSECINSDADTDSACDDHLDEFVYRELTTDTTSSLSFLGKRIFRQYTSEFILPDETRVSINRIEGTYPTDDTEDVLLSLGVGFQAQNIYAGVLDSDRDEPDSGEGLSDSLTDSDGRPSKGSIQSDLGEKRLELGTGNQNVTTQVQDQDQPSDQTKPLETTPKSSKRIEYVRGLQIYDYLEDDLWASTILLSDNSANANLLRQLEAGCRLEPEAYRMERVQRKRNMETVVDMHTEPTLRTLVLSRRNSDTDSIQTTVTAIDA